MVPNSRKALPCSQIAQRISLGNILPFPRRRGEATDLFLNLLAGDFRGVSVENMLAVGLENCCTRRSGLVSGAVGVEESILDALYTVSAGLMAGQNGE